MSSPQPLNILCFGDSLTEGYSMFGMKMTPYSRAMKEALDEKIGDEYDVRVTTRGKSGECVISDESVVGGRVGRMSGPGRDAGFLGRMRSEYDYLNDDQDPYDWVIFLGGTNDLGWGKDPGPIWDTIVKVTDIPLLEGARLLLMTVPESKARFRVIEEKREVLNAKIRGDEREGVYIFDLNKKVTYHGMSEEDRSELWDDGLHLSEAGYDHLGKLVAERLVGILEGREGRIEKGYEILKESRFEEVEDEEDDVDSSAPRTPKNRNRTGSEGLKAGSKVS